MKSLGFNAVHLYAESFDPSYPTNGSTAPGYAVATGLTASCRARGPTAFIWSSPSATAPITATTTRHISPISGNSTRRVTPMRRMCFLKSKTNRWPGGRLTRRRMPLRPARSTWKWPLTKPSAQYAPNTPVLLFTYAVFGGTGGASAALTDIHAFNTSGLRQRERGLDQRSRGVPRLRGWQGTSTAVSSLHRRGLSLLHDRVRRRRLGQRRRRPRCRNDVAELERLGVSWLTFQYIPPTGVSDDVTKPQAYSNIVVNAGLSWTPDYGNLPPVRGPYGNGG